MKFNLNKLCFLLSSNYNKTTKYLNLYNRGPTLTELCRNVSSSFNIFQRPSKKYNLATNGAILYENIVDKLDYNYFYKEFMMDDTLFSWFLITEMHVWMLMLRVMQEGDTGLRLRNFIVLAMWNDVNIRARKLGPTNAILVKSDIELLYEQFNASIIGYDEAIWSNDKFLAGHIWRRFFRCNINNPEKVEKLVNYIRKQIHNLNHTTKTNISSPFSSSSWMYENISTK